MVPATAAAAAGTATAAAAPEGEKQRRAAQSFLILHNVAKRKNFGDILRSAAALGVSEVAVVGAAKLSSHGAQGCAGHLRFSHFHKLDDAVAYLRVVHGAVITGNEIWPESRNVASQPFRGSHAFMPGNEGHGLTPAQLAVCDELVYIPQHSAATASLNVNAACAIVLHHFAMWAALPEAARDGAYKYVTEPAASSIPRSGVGLKQMRTLNADGTVAPRRRAGAAGEAGGSGGEGEAGELGEGEDYSWEGMEAST